MKTAPVPTGALEAPITFVEYFASQFSIQADGCWAWQGTKNPDGYGIVTVASKSKRSHRVALELMSGHPLPMDKVSDHLCRNRACVNPSHIELVTNKVNVLRGDGVTARNVVKTHCSEGHPLYGENLKIAHRVDGRAYRLCRICGEERERTRPPRYFAAINPTDTQSRGEA